MAIQRLVIATVLLLWATPAAACSQCLKLAMTVSVLTLGSLGLTTLGQLGLMRLRRREPFAKLSGLGRWTLGGLSTVHLLVGMGALWLGVQGEAILFTSSALALMALSLSGFKVLWWRPIATGDWPKRGPQSW